MKVNMTIIKGPVIVLELSNPPLHNHSAPGQGHPAGSLA